MVCSFFWYKQYLWGQVGDLVDFIGRSVKITDLLGVFSSLILLYLIIESSKFSTSYGVEFI